MFRLCHHHLRLTLPASSDSCFASSVPFVVGKMVVVVEAIVKDTYIPLHLVLLSIHHERSPYERNRQPWPAKLATRRARLSSQEEKNREPDPASGPTCGAGYTGDYRHRLE